MKRMKLWCILSIWTMVFSANVFAQGVGGTSSFLSSGMGYEENVLISEGLYKVKSGPFYGIVDRNGKVYVSVEYQDFQFCDGKALLTKDDYLWGIVDTQGNVKSFNGEYRVRYRCMSQGFIAVCPKKVKDKWGFIKENGEPFIVNGPVKGILSFGKKTPTLFASVLPFVDGITNVAIEKYGWKQFDTFGKEHFVLQNKKAKALFRTAVFKESCVIVAKDGIKQYQENSNNHAVVKLVLSSSATFKGFEKIGELTRISFSEGDLYIDSLYRAVKYVRSNDSIVFIETPKKRVVKKIVEEVPVEYRSLTDDLDISVSARVVNANAKGRAYTEVKVTNKSNLIYSDLTITIECAGTNREWCGNLGGNSEVSISLNLPARFSSEAIKRMIKVHVVYKDSSCDKEIPITIKRYTPVRSR